MNIDNPMNSAINKPVRKALIVDEDKDRYRRKERTDLLKQAGFKVYPVLRMQDARGRAKPGAFDVVVVNAGENASLAAELCDAIKTGDPKQQMFLVGAEGAGREYVVSNWDELAKRLGGTRQENKEPVAA